MIRRLLLFFALVTAFAFVASPLHAAAYDVFGGVGCGNNGSGSSAVCQDKNNGDTLTGNGGALLKVADIVAYIGGVAAIIIIIISAIRYITSGGDNESVSGAKRTLIGALIGLAVIVLAKSLITYIVSRL